MSNLSAANADELVVAALTELENAEITNSGVGSELTAAGTVELDAAVVFSDERGIRRQGAVGAVQGVPNPTQLAAALARPADPTASISQCNFMVGEGARVYASSMGIKTTPADHLITNRARRTRSTYLKKYEDTVCAIAISNDGHIAVASSSGGPILRPSGRVGPAAVPGAALAIVRRSQHGGRETRAAIASGFGEDMLSFGLSREACYIDNLDDLPAAMMAEILTQKPPYFGVIRAECSSDAVIVDWYHTTHSMVLSAGNLGSSPQTVCSDTPMTSGGFRFPLPGL